MFRLLKIQLKFGNITRKWVSSTRLDPGDKGQVARKAIEYINNLKLKPEDAWISALVNWMIEMPYPDSKEMLAHAIIQFLDTNGSKIAFSDSIVIDAREAAYEILEILKDSNQSKFDM